MLRCNNCGKENPDDSKFCQYCGSNQLENIVEVKPVNKKINNSKGLKIYSAVITALLVGLAIFSGILITTKHEEYLALEKEYSDLTYISERWHEDSDTLAELADAISNTNNDYFFADRNVITGSFNTYVRIEFNYPGAYTLTYNCPYKATCEWIDDGNSYDNVSWLRVSYQGDEVQKIFITNDINDEMIKIIVF